MGGSSDDDRRRRKKEKKMRSEREPRDEGGGRRMRRHASRSRSRPPTDSEEADDDRLRRERSKKKKKRDRKRDSGSDCSAPPSQPEQAWAKKAKKSKRRRKGRDSEDESRSPSPKGRRHSSSSSLGHSRKERKHSKRAQEWSSDEGGRERGKKSKKSKKDRGKRRRESSTESGKKARRRRKEDSSSGSWQKSGRRRRSSSSSAGSPKRPSRRRKGSSSSSSARTVSPQRSVNRRPGSGGRARSPEAAARSWSRTGCQMVEGFAPAQSCERHGSNDSFVRLGRKSPATLALEASQDLAEIPRTLDGGIVGGCAVAAATGVTAQMRQTIDVDLAGRSELDVHFVAKDELVVMLVPADGPADRAGAGRFVGQRLQLVNGEKVASAEEVERQVAAGQGKPVSLTFLPVPKVKKTRSQRPGPMQQLQLAGSPTPSPQTPAGATPHRESPVQLGNEVRGAVVGHSEQEGRTTYRCEFCFAGRLYWVCSRRLSQMRELHDSVVSACGKRGYRALVGETHFPPKGGLPGTTRRLDEWVRALCLGLTQKDSTEALRRLVLTALTDEGDREKVLGCVLEAQDTT